LGREAEVGPKAVVAFRFGTEIWLDIAARVFVSRKELIALVYFFPGVSKAGNNVRSCRLTGYDLPDIIGPLVAESLVPQPMLLPRGFVLSDRARLHAVQMEISDLVRLLCYGGRRYCEECQTGKRLQAQRNLSATWSEINEREYEPGANDGQATWEKGADKGVQVRR